MARKVFYSFHFNGDHWRASQVRKMGFFEANTELSDNDWEAVKRGGDQAIKSWIDGQIAGRSCAVVLVGAQTAERPWVKYEIQRAWQEGKGLVGIRIHKLLNRHSQTSVAGANPFAGFNVGSTSLASIVTLFEPAGADSKAVYAAISTNIASLVEAAIATRARY